ncbi:MAG: winged helix-turn-helix transcriptional regulator [Rhodobiaceae bacterium]|nr:winged helix-turn-helix transcriptional regulator [Rhodobiaceae bacterium]
MESLYAKPGHLLRRAHQIATAIFTEVCGPWDLTSVQYAALVAIGLNPGVDATRLSGLIAFDRSTLGGVLDRLENKGLVVRSTDPSDRRVKTLFLTDEGKSLLKQVEAPVNAVQERLIEPLSPADRKVFLKLLAALVVAHNPDLPASIQLSAGDAPSRIAKIKTHAD